MSSTRILASAFVLLATVPAFGVTIYVDDDAGPAGDGQAWTSAFRCLQDALAAADADPNISEIRLAAGVYLPDQDEAGAYDAGNPAAFFRVRDGLTIRGGYRGPSGGGDPNDRDPTTFETVLSGDLGDDDGPFFTNRGDNSRTIISTSGVAEALLDGLTVASAFDPLSGGGLLNTNGSPTIQNCIFRDNHGAWGGALSTVGAGRISLVDCSFINNRASNGGGAVMLFADADLINCRFLANLSYHSGGAVLGEAATLVANSVFIGNQAGFEEGGCDDQPTAVGGALCQTEGVLDAVNCVFSHNFAAETGGGIFLSQVDDARIDNCIFYLNRRCDGVHNFGAIYSTYSLGYCCIETNWPGEHLINADPLFSINPSPGADQFWGTSDDDFGDVHVTSGSACIDAGENDAVPFDLLDLDSDDDLAEYLPFDADARLRFADRLGTPDSGAGAAPIVDIGAFEYQCDGDLNGDGLVNLSDLAALLSNYGQTEHALYQDGDLDRDGSVGLADLAELLSSYDGECD